MESSKSNEVIVYEEIQTSFRKTLFVHVTLIFVLNLIVSAFYAISIGVKASSLSGLGYIIGSSIPIFSIAVVVPLIISALIYLITKRKWNCAKLMWGLFIGLTIIVYYLLTAYPYRYVSRTNTNPIQSVQEETSYKTINEDELFESLKDIHLFYDYLKITNTYHSNFEKFVLEMQEDVNVASLYENLSKTVDFGDIDLEIFSKILWGVMREDGISVYQDQVVKYTKIIANNPADYYAYFRRAVAKDELEDAYGARMDYNKSIKLNSKFAKAYYKRAWLNYKVDWDRGIDDLSKVIEIEPNNGKAYLDRGLFKVLKAEANRLPRDLSACIDFSKAGELGIKDAYIYIRNFCEDF